MSNATVSHSHVYDTSPIPKHIISAVVMVILRLPFVCLSVPLKLLKDLTESLHRDGGHCFSNFSCDCRGAENVPVLHWPVANLFFLFLVAIL